jgi:hypothetical protein
MQELLVAWNAIKFGGAMVYPLLVLGALAIAIIIDRAVLYAQWHGYRDIRTRLWSAPNGLCRGHGAASIDGVIEWNSLRQAVATA